MATPTAQTMRDLVTLGQTVTIKAAFGYEMLDPIAFRRTVNPTRAIAYAVDRGRVYVRFADGSTAWCHRDGIETCPETWNGCTAGHVHNCPRAMGHPGDHDHGSDCF